MKICVYTALIGKNWGLIPQPQRRFSELDFICFTDDHTLESEDWEIRYIDPILVSDPTRSQREIKLRPHRYLPKYDSSLYIDNTVEFSRPPEELIKELGEREKISLLKHSFRDTLYDEFIEVASQALDDQGRIYEQLLHYILNNKKCLFEKPYWGGITYILC